MLTQDGISSINHSFSRFNVFNTVKVSLKNQEFGKISTKELEVAKYLDFLHTVRLDKETDDEQLNYDKIIHISEVDHVHELAKNNQSVPTPLCIKFKFNWFSRGDKRDTQTYSSLRQLSHVLSL